jgi:hypothetical protein
MLTRRVLNSREHATLGLAPADLQFGIAHRLNRQLSAEEPRATTGDKTWSSNYWAIVKAQEKAITEARLRLAHKQAKRKESDVSMQPFQVGDWILVEVEGKRKTGAKKRDGPFRVVSVTPSTVTYESSRFPGRRLSVAVGRVSRFSVRPGSNPHRESLKEDKHYFVVEAIVGHRVVGSKKEKSKGPKINTAQVRVKWEGYDELSWEPLTNRTIRRLDLFREYVDKHPELEHLLP